MILCTGSSGFLGTHLVKLLRAKGCAVFAPPHSKYDLTQLDAVKAVYDECSPEIVIHLAARVGGIGANKRYPAYFFYENLQMGVNLMHEAWARGVKKFVLISTVCSYPKDADIPFRESEIWNGYPEPTNAPYGLAKKALMVMAQAYRAQFGFNAITLIPTNLYGPGDSFDLEMGHVIPAIIRKCVTAKQNGDNEIVLWGDGTPTREFLYVEDCARGIYLAMKRYDKGSPVNLGSGDEVSIASVASMIAEATRFNGRIVWDKDKPNGQPRRKVSTRLAEKEFGFEAKVQFAEGIARTVKWYQEFQCQNLPLSS